MRLSMLVEYRFAPGEQQDGASLNVPLLALPGLTRAALAARGSGLGRAAHRGAVAIAAEGCAPQLDSDRRNGCELLGGGGSRSERGAASCLAKERRGIPDALLRFDLAAVPAHLTVQLTVTMNGKEIARGADLADLRRECARRGPRTSWSAVPMRRMLPLGHGAASKSICCPKRWL